MREIIEQAVLQWYNIKHEELFSFENVYPLNGARSAYMYLLLEHGYTLEDIQELFGYNVRRTVELRIATVQLDINRKWGRFATDVEEIEKIIEQLKNK